VGANHETIAVVSRFVPLSKREQPDPSFSEPREGVPDYLWQPLIEWLAEIVRGGRGVPDAEWLLRLQTSLEVSLRWDTPPHAFDSLITQMSADRPLALDVFDYALNDLGEISETTGSYTVNRVTTLMNILTRGGSAWGVAIGEDQRAGLVRRLVGPVRESIEQLRGPHERAHHYLTEAWRKIFGRNPDPTDGWHEAVRAVEVVACPAVIPNDTRGTLGKVIAAIDASPSRWTFALGPPEIVSGMARGVWLSELRHGSADESAPLEATPEQAATAFHLALALVQIFASGYVIRA
jgi:hypothetical protein